ncbi:hypothetical protein DFP72DRAFT_840614 [Ephemerocybe angulata]|uniref:Uncharacterized protein n=1 Tax=Ephemerocybe angulata TaxID=980116 RepID=A0A8H6IHK0_9AGAR|nr:hypothetical protein DFP72DRAFT_840614 [Tulosesus angulatus]
MSVLCEWATRYGYVVEIRKRLHTRHHRVSISYSIPTHPRQFPWKYPRHHTKLILILPLVSLHPTSRSITPIRTPNPIPAIPAVPPDFKLPYKAIVLALTDSTSKHNPMRKAQIYMGRKSESASGERNEVEKAQVPGPRRYPHLLTSTPNILLRKDSKGLERRKSSLELTSSQPGRHWHVRIVVSRGGWHPSHTGRRVGDTSENFIYPRTALFSSPTSRHNCCLSRLGGIVLAKRFSPHEIGSSMSDSYYMTSMKAKVIAQAR